MGSTKHQDSYVRARIDEGIKAEATRALSTMGLTVSDAIRLLLTRVAVEQKLPFAIKVPNAKTRKAIEELESGQGVECHSIEQMMSHLNANN